VELLKAHAKQEGMRGNDLGDSTCHSSGALGTVCHSAKLKRRNEPQQKGPLYDTIPPCKASHAMTGQHRQGLGAFLAIWYLPGDFMRQRLLLFAGFLIMRLVSCPTGEPL
jgi:hypothetical protein